MNYLITDDLIYFKNYPFLYIKSIRAVVLGDVHIGQQEAITMSGSKFSSRGFRDFVEKLEEFLLMVDANKIVFNGDLKHNTNHRSMQEESELAELLNLDSLISRQVIFVIGNHDRFLRLSLKDWNYPKHWKILDHYYEKGYFIFHGDRLLEIPLTTHTVIISHEHPVIQLRGTNQKVKVFVTLELDNENVKHAVILPATGSYTIGINFPLNKQSLFLSPFLKKYALIASQRVFA